MADPQPQQRRAIVLADGDSAMVRLVVNPRARRISLRVDPVTREAIAVAPSARAGPRAFAFAQERAAWIASALQALPKAAPFRPGATIPVRGTAHLLVRVEGRAAPRLEPGPPPRLVVPALDDAAFAARVRRFLVSLARADLAERAHVHAASLGVRIARLTVKDTRSRWGSCTTAGALAFSWRVIFAPPFVLDYLAAHEVAHLLEMNHSARFWRLVDALTPRRAEAARWLKRHGAALHAIGSG